MRLAGPARVELQERCRRDLAENAAIFVACAALLECAGTSRAALSAWCVLFVVGRIGHVIGLSLPRNVNVLRIVGVFLTATVGIAFGVRLVTLAAAHWST